MTTTPNKPEPASTQDLISRLRASIAGKESFEEVTVFVANIAAAIQALESQPGFRIQNNSSTSVELSGDSETLLIEDVAQLAQHVQQRATLSDDEIMITAYAVFPSTIWDDFVRGKTIEFARAILATAEAK